LKRLSPYLLAFVAALAMAAVRLLLNPVLGNELPFITLFPAVFLAAWWGGFGPALTATFTGVLLALNLFFPPNFSFSVTGTVPQVGAVLFVVIGILTGWLGGSRLKVQARAEESEQRYRAFIEQTAEGVWRIELEEPVSVLLPEDAQIDRFYAHGVLAECNDAMAHMYGFERAEELVGARLGDLTPRSDPSNLEFLRAFIRNGYRLN
jgi:PAS domain-containing protein